MHFFLSLLVSCDLFDMLDHTRRSLLPLPGLWTTRRFARYSQMDNQKKNLLEALAKKGIAVAKLCVLDNNVKDRLEDIDNIYTEIIKFVDASDSKVCIQFNPLREDMVE